MSKYNDNNALANYCDKDQSFNSNDSYHYSFIDKYESNNSISTDNNTLLLYWTLSDPNAYRDLPDYERENILNTIHNLQSQINNIYITLNNKQNIMSPISENELLNIIGGN